jgi:hypothetical protein
MLRAIFDGRCAVVRRSVQTVDLGVLPLYSRVMHYLYISLEHPGAKYVNWMVSQADNSCYGRIGTG